MPFEAKETKVMSRKYGANGIPHLVVIDGDSFEVITGDGTEGVRRENNVVSFPWKPKSFGDVWPAKVNHCYNLCDNLSLDKLSMPLLLFYSSSII